MRLAVAALLVLAGCRRADGPTFATESRHGRPADALVINAGAEPEHLDPGKAADQGSATLALHLCEPLVTHHPRETKLSQGIAERVDRTPDWRRFRFHLRAGARWSDGEAIGAEHFAYAWRRVLTPEVGSRAAALLYVIQNGEALHRGKLARTTRALPQAAGGELPAGSLVVSTDGGKARTARVPFAAGAFEARFVAVPADALGPPLSGDLGVRAAGERELEVELENPAPHFLEIAANPTMCPARRDVIEPFERAGTPDLWTRPEHHVSSGPFVIESARLRYELVLRQNLHYHAAAAMQVRRVTFTFVEDAQTALGLYRTGEVDFFGNTVSLPSAALRLVERKSDFRRFPYLAVYWYELNTKHPPLDDARVRRALSFGVDRRTIAEDVLPAKMIPAAHVVPDSTGGGYGPALERAGVRWGDGFDPAKGRALLTEAGYPVERDGERWIARGFPSIEILYNNMEGHRVVAVAMQAMWEQHLGVRATLRAEEWKVVLAGIRQGKFDVGRYGWAAEYDHPHTFLEPFVSSSPQNLSRLEDPAFDDLLSRAAREPDERKAADLYVQAERRAVESASRIPVYFYTKSTMVHPALRGFVGNARNQHLAHWFAVGAEATFALGDLPPLGTF